MSCPRASRRDRTGACCNAFFFPGKNRFILAQGAAFVHTFPKLSKPPSKKPAHPSMRRPRYAAWSLSAPAAGQGRCRSRNAQGHQADPQGNAYLVAGLGHHAAYHGKGEAAAIHMAIAVHHPAVILAAVVRKGGIQGQAGPGGPPPPAQSPGRPPGSHTTGSRQSLPRWHPRTG